MEQSNLISTPAYKWCNKCGQWKPTAEFHKSKTKASGLKSNCKICCAYYQTLYRAKRFGHDVDKRYEHSPKGLARKRRWNQSPQKKAFYHDHPHYYYERYYRLQDEYGCHSDIVDWYPGYRIIKALENAEVVEIKL